MPGKDGQRLGRAVAQCTLGCQAAALNLQHPIPHPSLATYITLKTTATPLPTPHLHIIRLGLRRQRLALHCTGRRVALQRPNVVEQHGIDPAQLLLQRAHKVCWRGRRLRCHGGSLVAGRQVQRRRRLPTGGGGGVELELHRGRGGRGAARSAVMCGCAVTGAIWSSAGCASDPSELAGSPLSRLRVWLASRRLVTFHRRSLTVGMA